MILISLFQKAVETSDEINFQNFISASFDSYHHNIYLYARSRYKTYPEDVVQETFKKFQEAIRKGLEMDFRKDEDVLRYLTTIARNLSQNELGRAQRIVYVPKLQDRGKSINPYTVIQLKDNLESKLKLVSPQQAKMIRLKIAGYSYEEIAQELSMTVMAIKQGLYRSRKKLKLHWE